MDVAPPYAFPDLSWLPEEGSPLAEGFLWGVSTAGFQVEGGYNGPGEPRNNWAAAESTGRAVRSGPAVRFWTDWPRHLDLAAGMGLSAFRLSLEWTRLQPDGPGRLDPEAVARYADILAGCRDRGLEPVVTLHHFTHPSWLGVDPWLDGAILPAFEAHVTAAVTAVNRSLTERGAPPVSWYVTVNEPNILPFLTYALGAFPRGARPSPGRFRRALDHMLAAHVRAYRAVHRLYARQGWPQPMVGFNAVSLTAYALDGALTDLALSVDGRASGAALAGTLADRRIRWEDRLARLTDGRGRRVDALLQRLLLPDPETDLPVFVETLRTGRGVLDFIGIDYYVGPVADYLRRPTFRRDRRNPAVAELWETTIRPEGIRMFLDANHHPDRPIPLVIAENGMCTRVRVGRDLRRPDGWTRPAFIRAHVAELLGAARDGLPVAGYLHWTLADNYEWGSYQPAFGLYGVDRRGEPILLSKDADGEDSAGTYRRIVTALGAGDGGAAATALSAP